MNKLKMACLTAAIASSSVSFAGGLLTNTNQNVAFNRMMSREASIGIDGVYYNPAGVVFLGEGHHLSLNWQLAYQTRIIKNGYDLFKNNVNNPITPREFKGEAFAPVIPSLQYAYNKGRWSFQANLALTGGGGKCTFDNGLGSFEKIVGETAMGACGLAGAVDGAAKGALGAAYPKNIFSEMFGSDGKYSYDSYMHGRQYYYGISIGAAYKVSDNFSAFAGLRTVYASCNYYGYVRDIKVGNTPLYTVLDPSKTDAADILLSCDQTGLGFTPIIGIDYKTGRWNFSAKYEFKTRMRLKNKSVNQAPSIGNLAGNLRTALIAKGVPEVVVDNKILGDPKVQAVMLGIKSKFDTALGEAVGEYEDGKKIAGDIPAYLTLGAGYAPTDDLRINVGFHWFDDKNATSYNNRNKKLDRGTLEYNAGAEYDINKRLTVSAGWQCTSYGLSDEYMDDKSFVVSSNSVGVGGVIRLTSRMKLNVAYFHTFYEHKKTSEESTVGTNKYNYTSDYTRNNNVFGVGLDVKF
ncbi:OmpP1/FadL family transporter [Prevotella merdae]|uniref:OmpP1/FadL family transporter n=1 Tax=Prevotella merdae TaxID=2079531 RepID=UPI000D101160|nr:outer membrane beta-barrel protein [Prevotella merdae]